MARVIDLMHLGRDRVIAAHELRGIVVDPGPASCVETLLGGLESEPRALLLTHIHLDHAGATGVLVRRFPDLRVYVHEAGAPHLIDPSRFVASATRLYGDDMERLWGEVAPVPEANVSPLDGGEEVEGFRVAYAPGHARHHVCFLDSASGDAYVGDVAGVRIPPAELTVMPTPPPDIDVEAWLASLDVVAAWSPERLHLTHFGAVDEPAEQLEAARETLRRYAERARGGDHQGFIASVDREIERGAGPAEAERHRQAAPPEQLWLGLERYWRKRAETTPPRG
jgi:glyoxylase-like metal-dependent hydrolase (beta-lactamase superfamily II)